MKFVCLSDTFFDWYCR